MGWKDWPYWLKGGLKGIMVGIILLIPSLIWGSLCQGEECSLGIILSLPVLLPAFLLGFPLLFFVTDNPLIAIGEVNKPVIFILILGGVLAYFIIGAMVSLIRRKIKFRSENSRN